MESSSVWDESIPAVREAIRTTLVEAKLIEPVASDPASFHRWHAYDLASIIEGCFGEIVDAAAFDESAWMAWKERIGRSFIVGPYHATADASSVDRDEQERYWLLDAGRPVGTIRLDRRHFGGVWLSISALYVTPSSRGRGLATRALRASAQAATQAGLLGIKLGTSWTWQRSLRFYLDRGFWVWNWKHDLRLVLVPSWPQWSVSFAGDEVTFQLRANGKTEAMFVARRREGTLVIDVMPLEQPIDIRHTAMTTFSTVLAVHGWPLVRSEKMWADRYGWSDAGDPEGIAYKIGVFEELARESGWRVETPRIPELERWQAWAQGEEHGRRHEAQHAIEVVLRERKFPMDEVLQQRLRSLMPWDLEEILRRAVTAPSFEDWHETLVRVIDRYALRARR